MINRRQDLASAAEVADLAGSELGRLVSGFVERLGTGPTPAGLGLQQPDAWLGTQFLTTCAPVMAAVHQAVAAGDHIAAERLAAPLDHTPGAPAGAALRDQLPWPDRQRIPLLNPSRTTPHPWVLFAVQCALFRIPLAQTLQGCTLIVIALHCARQSVSPKDKQRLLASANTAVSHAIGLTAPASRFHLPHAKTCPTSRG